MRIKWDVRNKRTSIPLNQRPVSEGKEDRSFTCTEGTYVIVLMSACGRDLASYHVGTLSFLHTSDFEILSILNN